MSVCACACGCIQARCLASSVVAFTGPSFCHTTDGVLLEPHPNGGGGKWSGGLACHMPERDDEMSGAALWERATRCEPMAQGGDEGGAGDLCPSELMWIQHRDGID